MRCSVDFERFTTVDSRYVVSYDPSQVGTHLTQLHRWFCSAPDYRKREGCYFRWVVQPDEGEAASRCFCAIGFSGYRITRMILPIFLYLGAGGTLERAVYDSEHHNAGVREASGGFDFTVIAPWHALCPGRFSFAAKPMEFTFLPLEDRVDLVLVAAA